jgi:hypothetical protein
MDRKPSNLQTYSGAHLVVISFIYTLRTYKKLNQSLDHTVGLFYFLQGFDKPLSTHRVGLEIYKSNVE